MPRRGSGGGSTRARTSDSGGGSRRRGGSVAGPEKSNESPFLFHVGDLGPIVHPLQSIGSILGYAIGGEKGQKIGGTIGQVPSVLGSSPYYMAAHPKAAVGDVWEMVRGVPEAASAIYTSTKQQGVKATAALLMQSLVSDYKARYGSDWQTHAKQDPLFNFLDLTAVLGLGLRGIALTKAISDLDRAGIAAGPLKVWKESSRPGLISEGQARGRLIRAPGAKEGTIEEAFQPSSTSPLRRGFQSISDALSERYPDAPMMGAKARVARANARGLTRETERLLGQVADPHAVEALSGPLKTRLYWSAQIGATTTKELKQFRDLLKDALKPGRDLPDDPGFREVVQEARRSGFGQQMLKRLDAAIEAKPNARYDAAHKALEDMTIISEQVQRDANGFSGLKGDIKRARDRLSGLDPRLARRVDAMRNIDQSWDALLESVPKEMRQAVLDVLEPTKKLREKDGQLTEMFRSRRNRLRDWRNAQVLAQDPVRAARLEEMTKLFGADEAQQAIQISDALANRMSPNDVSKWYRERVGMPTGETPDELVNRLGQQPDWQRQMVLEAAAEAQSGKGTIFYSPLQKGVADATWKRQQAKQLKGVLRQYTSKDELEESGINDWIDSLDPESFVTKEQVLNYFANPANAYGIEEVMFSGRSERYGLNWFHWGDQGLQSRQGDKLDFRQIIFRVPDKDGEPRYQGKGKGHWSENNVIAHMRFWDTTFKGKRTMIVEEVQSDWLSQWLEDKKVGGLVGKPNPGHEADYQELIRQVHEEYMPLKRKADELDDKLADAYDTPEEADLEIQVEDAWAEAGNYASMLEDEAMQIGVSPDDLFIDAMPKTGKSPLSEEAFIRMGVRRLLRYAAENGIEQIIIPEGNIHRYRYKQFKTKLDADMRLGKQDPEEITKFLREQAGESSRTNMFNRLYDYGRGVPKQFAKELGQDGEHSDQAFWGRYSWEMSEEDIGKHRSSNGWMPGTVFNLGDADRTRHAQPAAAFQRQPNWKGLPKGANELLGNGGQNLIHLFSRADLSTWIHELGHSALYDLAGDDLRTVESHFAGGKKVAEWTDAERENFARTWEQYFRHGEAPTEELRAPFEKISQWMKDLWTRAKQKDIPIPEEISAVFDRMLAPDPADDVKIFIPHRTSAPELTGARTSKGIPRASRDIGDRALSRIPLYARNKLGLLRMGMLHDDPALLTEHMNRVVMLARANQLREAVLEIGEPLMPDEIPDFKTQYVVKKTGRGVNKPLYDAMEAADDPAEIRDNIKNFVDEFITDDRQKWEAWRGKEQLYTVDKDFVDKLFKNVTGKTPGATTKPETQFTKVADAGLDAVRAMLLYLNPGFYTANLLGNATMMGLSDPRAARFVIPSFKEAMKAAHKPETADPLWKRVSIEMGRGPTSGGLSSRPPLLGREAAQGGPLPGRVAENISLGIGEYGRRSGRIIDDAMRVAVWKQVAHKRGYTSDSKIKDLLDTAAGGRLKGGKAKPPEAKITKARRELSSIRDEAEQLMLDFDSMTPFEKTWLTRMIFLYPFLKASAKWPIMFVGERPTTAAAVAELGNVGEDVNQQLYGPRPPLPLWMQGAARIGPGRYFSSGPIAPMAPIADLAASLLGLGGTPATGISRPIDYLNPLAQLGIELAQGRSQFGQELTAPSIMRQDAPMTALQRQILGLKQPSETYTDRGLFATLLRSLRFVPYGVNEPPVTAPPPTRSSSGGSRRRGNG